jgi:hypothetical protein
MAEQTSHMIAAGTDRHRLLDLVFGSTDRKSDGFLFGTRQATTATQRW